MKTKIKCNDLKEISSFITSKSEEIDLLFDDIGKTIESVQTAWMGNDCKEFIKEAESKINEEKTNNKQLKKFAEDLSVVANDYIDFENKWAEAAKRESLGNE